MSYYRYITGVYKSYWPQLNRTLRSSSVPRSVPDLDPVRYSRASSVPPSAFSSNAFISSGHTSAMPFRDRAASLPPQCAYSWERNPTYSAARESIDSTITTRSSYNRSRSVVKDSYSHYTDFDCKVIDYMGKLDREDALRNYVSKSRARAEYYPETDYRSGFSSKYNFYDGGKFGKDYLYSSSENVMGTWKHYNLSNSTIKERNTRAKSPLITRELDRYYETSKRSTYIGDVSSGPATDFRFYNYRRVPYFGGSDGYQYVPKYLKYLDSVEIKY